MIPHAFPKIFTIGSKQTQNLFNGEVEITEKLDGSQIGFGVINGELIIRSKGQQIFLENFDKMFQIGVDYINKLHKQDKLNEGIFIYGEYLKSNRHNILCYDRIPRNNIAIYGATANGEFISDYYSLMSIAENLNLDMVPLLYKGEVSTIEKLKSNLDRESYLGKSKIEGFVVKNYTQDLLIGGQVIPILMGKYVSEEFKEVHNKNWKKENTGKGRWEVYKSLFATTARWQKAIQHLQEKGELEQSPKDIGKLLKEINNDIESEEKENIKEFLWNEFGKEVLRTAGKGFPQWYKDKLLESLNVK